FEKGNPRCCRARPEPHSFRTRKCDLYHFLSKPFAINFLNCAAAQFCTFWLARQRSHFFLDARENGRPDTCLRLPEQAHCRIPRAMVSSEHPRRMRYRLQSDPCLVSKRSPQMANRRVGSDYKIEATHHCGGVNECVWTVVEVIAQYLDVHTSCYIIAVFLQANQPNARNPS